jgi:threonine synthase
MTTSTTTANPTAGATAEAKTATEAAVAATRPVPAARPWRGIIAEYRERLPVDADTPVVSLGEGGTPLVHSDWLSELTGCEVFIKVEGANPTGSFKDRGMTMAVSRAVQAGSKAVVCASTGNTSASAAAYAGRAGLECIVLLPAGKIARGKLAQAVVHGARLVQVEGNFDDCLTVARELPERYPVVLVNSANADGYRLAGQMTAAWEIVDTLGRAPDLHLLPVGNAGNITAYWAGYRAYAKLPPSGPHGVALPASLPRIWGFQAAGSAPIVSGRPVASPETVATAIRVGNPARWSEALAALSESAGTIAAIADEQILAAQALLARRDGIFVEPASAIGVAGLLAAHAAGTVDRGLTITITVTGNGLKDTDTALAGAAVHDAAAGLGSDPLAADTVAADPDAVAALLGLG